jgi:predicted HAD superfamily Cof-like phosphohydrolase
MNRQFKQVVEFNTLFKQQLNNKPTLLGSNESELCISLLREELNEYADAVGNGNLVEIADALIDLDYVLKGVMLKHGLVDAYEPLFDEVHNSNMSKICNDINEANRTVKKYKLDGIDTNIIKNNNNPNIIKTHNNFLVLRASDKKILKSVDYLPAILAPIINEYL